MFRCALVFTALLVAAPALARPQVKYESLSGSWKASTDDSGTTVFSLQTKKAHASVALHAAEPAPEGAAEFARQLAATPSPDFVDRSRGADVHQPRRPRGRRRGRARQHRCQVARPAVLGLPQWLPGAGAVRRWRRRGVQARGGRVHGLRGQHPHRGGRGPPDRCHQPHAHAHARAESDARAGTGAAEAGPGHRRRDAQVRAPRRLDAPRRGQRGVAARARQRRRLEHVHHAHPCR